MFIDSERQLEEYIIEDNNNFMNKLKETFDIDAKLNYIGNQIRLGDIICDMLYYFETTEEIAPKITRKQKNYIVIENKFRYSALKDIAQISRYMSVIKDKIFNEYEEEVNVYGAIVSFGCDSEMQEVLINESFKDIKCISIISKLRYQEEMWSRKKEYIDKIKLDERLLKTVIKEE